MNPLACPKCQWVIEGVQDKFRCPNCKTPLKLVKPLFKEDNRVMLAVDFEESQKREKKEEH